MRKNWIFMLLLILVIATCVATFSSKEYKLWTCLLAYGTWLLLCAFIYFKPNY